MKKILLFLLLVFTLTSNLGSCASKTPNIILPQAPVNVDFNGDGLSFTDLGYEFTTNKDKTYNLILTYTATKTYTDGNSYSGKRIWFDYKIYDSNGYVVNTGSSYVGDFSVGEKIKGKIEIATNLDFEETYRVQIY